jgi:hypothetical protein
MVVEVEPRAPSVGLPVIVYVVSLVSSIFIVRAYRPETPIAVLIFAVPAAALVWMIVQARRAKRFRGGLGCGSSNRTYQRRILGLALAYVALLFLANWLYREFALTGPAAVVVALLPALPLIGMVFALGSLIVGERDEYQRLLHVRQMLVATGLMLAVCTVWGFLEQFELVPHVPAYWAFIVWCGGLGVGTLYNELRP